MTIWNLTGAVKAGDLLLFGACSECRGDVARMVEFHDEPRLLGQTLIDWLADSEPLMLNVVTVGVIGKPKLDGGFRSR